MYFVALALQRRLLRHLGHIHGGFVERNKQVVCSYGQVRFDNRQLFSQVSRTDDFAVFKLRDLVFDVVKRVHVELFYFFFCERFHNGYILRRSLSFVK